MPARKRKSKLLGHGSGHDRHVAEKAARRAEELVLRAASRPSNKPAEVARRRAEAFRFIAEGASYRQAAKKAGTGASRLRKEARELELVAPTKVGRKVELVPEAYEGMTREMTTFSNGNVLTVSLDRTEAVANAHYLNAAARAIVPGKGTMTRRKDLKDMADGVTDIDGVFHPWEKRVTVLRTLMSTPDMPIVYMIVKA